MSREQIARIYVEKRPGFDGAAQRLKDEFREQMQVTGLENVRLLIRYDFPALDEKTQDILIRSVFSEPNQDVVYGQEILDEDSVKNACFFAVEYLPGQYDARADWAGQCAQLITGEKLPVKVSQVYVLEGDISPEEVEKIKHYIINPVDSKEASFAFRERLEDQIEPPAPVDTIDSFLTLDEEELEAFRTERGFAMSADDIRFIQNYFRDDKKRNPTETELKVIDTYWSDHCRHTTFQTRLNDIQIDPSQTALSRAYQNYQKMRESLYGENTERPVTLMDLATIGAKALRKAGKAEDLDLSEEINACSINIKVDHDGVDEDWLLMFKNETHNHPTEIEPFGGAATCLGGAIRDPLSGRAYVYQSMRVTGAADPRVPVDETLEGKLPQRKIVKGAADGFSAYGNQIGLATGQVEEIYHPGFLAKRLETGAVVAAVPKENVIREVPEAGDVVLLIGGRTGRDGIGGATGSSVAHTQESTQKNGAQVQKGNPVEERKIQRLFRDPELARKIRRCNDFGAGGVSVAVGELADSLLIDLDRVPKKYEGLDGTELAISESQERMAVVVRPEDVDLFVEKGAKENLEVTKIAEITDDGRLVMRWRGQTILDLSRDFLNTNGAPADADVSVQAAEKIGPSKLESFKEAVESTLMNLNTLSQKGLGEQFDGTIGTGSVLMPYGGTYALTPQEGMAAKIPVEHGDTTTVSVMSYATAPLVTEKNPYLGGANAVIRSLSKIAAMGADPLKVRMSFQEYFESLGDDPQKWGRPFAALLGALEAQTRMEIPAIGGKDSMSGTFEDLTVPPTIIGFSVVADKAAHILSAELKKPESGLFLIDMPENAQGDDFDYDTVRDIYRAFKESADRGEILSAKTANDLGVLETALLMSFGNKIGVEFTADFSDLIKPRSGAILFESETLPEPLKALGAVPVGKTIREEEVVFEETRLDLNGLIEMWESGLRDVFPEKAKSEESVETLSYQKGPVVKAGETFASPRILIPAFPGTNCETDTARAFEAAGGVPEIALFRNLSEQDIKQSVDDLVRAIENAQIIALPGGFSAGDEPAGSGKFITAVFRNPRVMDAVTDLLENRDGLMLGICNGFQALIKLGLVPYGKIVDLEEGMPTLTFNTIGRHVSTIPRTRVVSDLSPWLSGVEVGDIFRVPMSHTEGRFVADDKTLETLIQNGQVATQYVDLNGRATMDGNFNPNGSRMAIEGITSPDGRVLGKMGHSERVGRNLYKNIPGEQDQKIFQSGIAYFQ